ncbi:cobalamin biosynthesis protein CobQ [Roseobacter sinensis]|uniref:Cobalamin biosynthesis protein CobQ n=1 Tax=Roseobacter sinensis TaxID=2931391 RepID=A0ABT3BG63_9RHOB|nr:cobalamin biosynthesis protein CobQ [Roseobacter sp. WL0113]MCV3272553.1 cobalamin biosynthesis protein CobQ [Roseobacter sp. WL0113]
MNTPAHLLIGAAVMGRKGSTTIVLAALLGALLPDLSLYLLAGNALYISGIAPAIVFDELYFSQSWQTIFAIDNSFIVWGGLFALALWRGAPWAIALTGAALLHLCLDFPFHHDDGRAHFWPLSGWVFESPLSYWDRDHGAMWLAPVEASAATLAALALWQRRFGWGVLALVAALLIAEIWIVRQWLFFFVDS